MGAWDWFKGWWQKPDAQLINKGAEKSSHYFWLWLKQNWFMLVITIVLVLAVIWLVKVAVGWLKRLFGGGG